MCTCRVSGQAVVDCGAGGLQPYCLTSGLDYCCCVNVLLVCALE